MAVNPDEDTEFNDALRQHGILPPKPAAPRTPSPPPSPTLGEALSKGSPTLDELDLLAEDEGNNSDDERLLESYRRQRLNEIKKENKSKRRFGDIYPIGRDDYTREVTEGSKAPEEDEAEKVDGEGWNGTGVICLLYQPSEPASVRVTEQLRDIARRYPRTKVVSIVGNKCIENYPDRHCPSLFLYRNGALRQQFIAYGKDRERTVDELEVLLIATNMIDPRKASKVEAENARQQSRATQQEESDIDDSDDDGKATGAGRGTGTVNGGAGGHGSKRTIRTGTHGRDDDDSDFDL
ncbi:thioredoxin-like protein [Clavulina sp. PMI_390]|nr:thioredoxin-like protein [Clavulina sp. PMI_390]